jgi:serine phosphatase RsbU (regulator of sigma subunit)
MRRIDAPQPGDREQLAELVVQLGFDRARIEADAIVIRRVRSWEQKVSEIPELERKEKEIGRKTTALKKQHEALRQEGRKATALIASRRQLERELIKLRCDHAPLLAEEPVSEGEFCVADAAR